MGYENKPTFSVSAKEQVRMNIYSTKVQKSELVFTQEMGCADTN